MTDKLQEAKESLEMAYLIQKKMNARDESTRQEIREWLEDAQVNIKSVLRELDMIEQHQSASGRSDFKVLAKCTECRWNFHNRRYEQIRYDETDSKRDVASRQAFYHSEATGHAVRSMFDINE